MRSILPVVAVLVIGILGIFFFFSKDNLSEDKNTVVNPANNMIQEQLTPPPLMLNLNKQYNAVIKTSAGDIDILLNSRVTPITVNNFVFLAKRGFYNNTIFHRVIKGFMIQGGDPKGDGTGGPGYNFKDEPFDGEYVRGTVAMANSGPNTNGSQFFIMQEKQQLPKSYVIFGKVTSGLDVVDKIANAPVEDNNQGEMSKPINPVVVAAVDIIER